MLNIEEIQKILPQKPPFLMIDRVLEIVPQKMVVAIKNVSYNEWFFAGHFPGRPVMPGVLIIEAMAQSAIILFSTDRPDSQEGRFYYLGSVKARFLNPVSPGDQLEIRVEPIKVISGAALVQARARVGDKEVAQAELSFSVKKE
jgi:3-hydroxyacyl-[acyl-carrier-protein] dehydratase